MRNIKNVHILTEAKKTAVLASGFCISPITNYDKAKAPEGMTKERK